MIEFATEHFIAQGDRVVMLGRCAWRYKKTGKVVWTQKADFWRFAGGKAIEYSSITTPRRCTRRWHERIGTAEMNVFVAGASGVIGQPLLKLLRDAGHAVTGTTRSQPRSR